MRKLWQGFFTDWYLLKDKQENSGRVRDITATTAAALYFLPLVVVGACVNGRASVPSKPHASFGGERSAPPKRGG